MEGCHICGKMISQYAGCNCKPQPGEPDNPISPKHYRVVGEYQAIDIIKATLTPEEYKGYLKGNILKYHLRAHNKNGAEDYAKAGKYQDWLEEENARL